MRDLPIVCTLLPSDLDARAMQLLPRLAAAATDQLAIEGGWRFEFPANSETLSAIVAMVDAERQCCRFLRFQLTLEPDEGPVRLDVTGPFGTQDFLTLINPQRPCGRLPDRIARRLKVGVVAKRPGDRRFSAPEAKTNTSCRQNYRFRA